MKKINIITFGSTGDVLPHAALGAALKDKGYYVSLTTHVNYRDLVQNAGLVFNPVELDVKKLLEMTLGREWIKGGKSVAGFIGNIRKVMEPYLDIMTSGAKKGAEDADLIIFSTLADCGQHIAEYMGIPCIGSVLQPLVPTTEYTCPMWPLLPFNFPLYNKFSFKFSEVMLWKTFEKPAEMWRINELKLPKVGLLGPYRRQEKRHMPFLVPISPSVLKRPSDWPDSVHLTGYWFHDDYSIDREIEGFFEKGDKPLYVGFGSMTMYDDEKKRFTEILNAMLLKHKKRAIIHSGWADLGEKLSADVIVKKHLNHRTVLPHCSAAVHHCGAGTTAAVLRAGIPSVACPMFADQFFWADRIVKLGAGVRIDFDNISKNNIELVLEQVLTNSAMQDNAAKVSSLIREEKGAYKASMIVDRYFKKYCGV